MDNTSLNLNSSRSDKFSLVLSDIPSIQYVNEENPDEVERNLERNEGYDNFMLSLGSLDLPGITHGEEKVGSVFTAISESTMVSEFDSFTTEIKIDSAYYVYKLLFVWMLLIKNPYGYNQFPVARTEQEFFVDGSVLIRDNMENKPMLQFDFVDLRPISLPSLSLDYKTDEELTLSVTWGYTAFYLRNNRGEDILKI